jgi:hypothetical protein
MEYCKDGDLRSFQKKNFKNQLELEKNSIILQILNGLEYVIYFIIFNIFIYLNIINLLFY